MVNSLRVTWQGQQCAHAAPTYRNRDEREGAKPLERLKDGDLAGGARKSVGDHVPGRIGVPHQELHARDELGHELDLGRTRPAPHHQTGNPVGM